MTFMNESMSYSVQLYGLHQVFCCCNSCTGFPLHWCVVVKQPFAAWVTKAVSEVTELLRQASDWKTFVDTKKKLEGIQEFALTKEEDVSALSKLSTNFEGSRKVS